jgi:hypothetical protein
MHGGGIKLRYIAHYRELFARHQQSLFANLPAHET